MDYAADAFRTDLMTITRHVLNEQSRHPESCGDVTILLSHMVLGCKFVASAVNKAGFAKLIGLSGETNVQGSHSSCFFSSSQLFFHENGWYDDDCLFALVWVLRGGRSRRSWTCSPARCSSMSLSAADAPYCVCFDPLDGSSNSDCGVSSGTMFGTDQEPRHRDSGGSTAAWEGHDCCWMLHVWKFLHAYREHWKWCQRLHA